MAATSDEEMDSLLSTLDQIYQVGTNLPLPPSFLTILYSDSVWLPRKPRKKKKKRRRENELFSAAKQTDR